MKQLTKYLSWITTIPFAIAFFGILCIFHIFQIIALKVGYQAHNRVINSMSWWLNSALLVSGNRIIFKNQAGKLPTDKPMIIISNHQSMYDIPAIVWALKPHHPKFIAKKALERGVPSVSFNIRHGGSITIDRKDAKGAVKKIIQFCKYLKDNNRAGCIFVEGRRSRDGQLSPFKSLGVNIMLKKLPEATVVPVVIDNFWKIRKYKFKPVPFGNTFKCTVLPPIDRNLFDNDAILDEAERMIRVALGQFE